MNFLKNWYSTEVATTITPDVKAIAIGSAGPNAIINTMGTGRADWLTGSNSADMIDGQEGDDYIYGGAGNDTIYGGFGLESGNDTIDGGAGDDELRGVFGDDHLYGNYGNDIIWGGDGNDIVDGGHGRDTLNGGDGNDRLVAGRGQFAVSGLSSDCDDLTGGDGVDTFDLTGVAYDLTSDKVIIRDLQADESVLLENDGVEFSRYSTVFDGARMSAFLTIVNENGTIDTVVFENTTVEQAMMQVTWL